MGGKASGVWEQWLGLKGITWRGKSHQRSLPDENGRRNPDVRIRFPFRWTALSWPISTRKVFDSLEIEKIAFEYYAE
jgi:hypothetical protein